MWPSCCLETSARGHAQTVNSVSNSDRRAFIFPGCFIQFNGGQELIEKPFLKDGIYVVQTDLELSV